MALSPPFPVSDLDPFSEAFLTDPFPFHAALRDAGPVVRLERYGVWAVARHADVFATLTDPAAFISGAGVGITDFRREPPPRPPSIILEADPPLHTRTHKILARALSPQALHAMRAGFEAEAAAHVERLLARGGVVDGVREIAEAYPLQVFSDAVGVPDADREALPIYGSAVFNFFGPHNALFERSMAEVRAVVPRVMALCDRTAVRPGSLAANVYAAADAGECTDQEAAMLVRSLLSAGLDTTVASIACALLCFARFPEQWDRVRADPALARAAFDEAIRLESPVQTFFRTAACPTQIAGFPIDDGAKVLMFLASANRDPAKWEDPDTFDVTRKTGAHVGFGAGIHRCVGEMLAKIEGEIFIAALARRVRRIELAGDPVPRFNNTLRLFERMPLILTPAGPAGSFSITAT